MADDIPYEGLHRVVENKVLENAVKDFNAPIEKLAEIYKSTDTVNDISRLKQGIDASLQSYRDFQEQVVLDIKQLKENGASVEELNAYLKKNKDFHDDSAKSMVSALDKLKSQLSDLANSDEVDAKDKYILNKQLRILEKSYDLQESHFNKQINIFERMNEDLDHLRESDKEQQRKEKRQTQGKFKDTLLTTMLGPFRLLTDPLLKAFNNNRDTFSSFENKTEKTNAKYEIYERSRVELNKLADEKRENDRLEALAAGADVSGFEKPSITSAGMKALRESFTPKALLTGLKASLGFGEMSFADYSEQGNRQEAKETLYKNPKTVMKEFFARNKQGHQALPVTAEPLALASPLAEETSLEQGHQALPVTAEPLALASPLAEETSLEQGHQALPVTAELEELNDPMLDKMAPDQSTLLAKGGVVGAGVVFLAKKLGLITDAFDDAKKKNDDEDGLGKGAIDFIKKNGLSLLKVAAPLAVMAVGGVMVAKGLQMQQRDTDDAQKYFEEGDTARGVETFLLGDRERLTEENANQELGRTAGKTALMAGGTGALVAGGIGTTAVAGTLIGGGGLAAAGTAGIAALGAALPPALIAAAVVTAGMVVAKGTQEAFELGWDKNQAVIQKELTDTMLSEDASLIDKIKAGVESTWKGLTGGLAGGIREAGQVLDAETMIQNEKQISYIKEQAEAGSESHQRLLEMMQSEQFKALSEEEQKAAMQAEGLYDDFKGAQEATRKSIGEHLTTAGRTIGGFFTGLVDTTMEGMRGRETAVWEKAALKGMENMSGDDVTRLEQSKDYQEAIANGGDRKKAMETAYLAEKREEAIARGDLREDGMAIQEGNWLTGMVAGGAAGGIPGAIGGALGGSIFGKYLGFGDTGMAYKEKQSDEEYRQTFEYSKKKAELMGQGMTAEEADLAAIEEQNALYDQAMTLRLKQSKDYKKEFDKKLKEGKSIKEAEEAALRMAKENKRNTMTTTELVKDKFTEMGTTLKNWAGNIGNFFKEKFSAAGEGLADLGNMIKEGAMGVWNAVSEWFSGIWTGLADKVKGALGAVGDGVDWVKGKAGDALDWAKGLLPDFGADAKIDDGIVTKDGKVIELSPDDNVYATKNEPRVIRDVEAQRAMPDVPRTVAEFTDAGIIAAIRVLTDVLRNKEMSTTVASPGESMNFDQYKMADALV